MKMQQTTKQNQRTKTISMMLGALLFAGIVTVSTDAEAGRGRRGKKGQKGRMGYCGGMLKHGAKGPMLAKLKLSEAQTRNIEAISKNFQNKRIDLKARLAKLRLSHQQLMRQDQPPQDRVLSMVRQRRHLHGLLAEERVKAQLKIRAALTPEQRKQLQQTVSKRKARRGFGKGRFHNRRGKREDLSSRDAQRFLRSSS